MGDSHGGYGGCAALCMRGRDDSSFAAMAVGGDEHGFCGCLYDHRPGNEDYESGGGQDRAGNSAFYALSFLYHALCFSVRFFYEFAVLRAVLSKSMFVMGVRIC